MTRKNRHGLGWTTAAIIAITSHAGFSLAQTPAQQPATNTGTVMLQQDPFEIEAMGLAIYIPEGAQTSTSTMGSTATASFFDGRGVKPAWQVIISTRSTTNADLTVEQVIDEASKQLLNVNAVLEEDSRVKTDRVLVKPGESEAAVIDRQPAAGQTMFYKAVNGDQLPVARVYVAIPEVRGRTPVVRGITAVKVSPQQFVLFELLTTGDVFKDMRSVYETSVASTEFRGVVEATVQRAELVSAGTRILASYDADALIEVAENTPERWERLYRPAADGKRVNDEEVGYRRISVSYGKPGSKRGGGEAGIIVEIDARIIDKSQMIDTKSWFYMTPDRAQENWDITMAVRDTSARNAKPALAREIGARLDNEMTVRTETGGPADSKNFQTPAEGFVSRAEGFLLPGLLIKKAIPGRYGYYGYQPTTNKVSFRRDVLDKGPNDTWKLTTRLAEGQNEQTQIFRADGTLLSGTLQNGIHVEPTTLQDLIELWKKKGLPISDSN
ncbi:MAG TPA: hypothetical protein VK157_12105 [Phycisphaerales bacterium]|nr:hypothetical protein [Phycisphaerales bacterium]